MRICRHTAWRQVIHLINSFFGKWKPVQAICLSQMVHALKRYREPKLEKVGQAFLSAHIHQTGTSESCVSTRHDAPCTDTEWEDPTKA